MWATAQALPAWATSPDLECCRSVKKGSFSSSVRSQASGIDLLERCRIPVRCWPERRRDEGGGVLARWWLADRELASDRWLAG